MSPIPSVTTAIKNYSFARRIIFLITAFSFVSYVDGNIYDVYETGLMIGSGSSATTEYVTSAMKCAFNCYRRITCLAYSTRRVSQDRYECILSDQSPMRNTFQTSEVADSVLHKLRLHCGLLSDHSLATPGGNTPFASFTVTNQSGRFITVYWIDYHGVESGFLYLANGESNSQGSYEGHVWVAADTDGIIVPLGGECVYHTEGGDVELIAAD